MAIVEKDGLLSYIDEAGNTYILYPISKLDNIDGAENLLKIIAQELTEAQKTQARTNIGAAAESHNHTKSDIADFPAIPSKTSDLTNDSLFVSESELPEWVKEETKPTYTASEVGADAKGTAASKVSEHNSASDAHSTLFGNKQDKPTAVSGSGAVNFTCADNREYAYTDVTSLTMVGAAVECHGFIAFGSSAPTINVSGFTASGGDDITGAAASEVWEFSVMPHSSGAYIIWKNWSAA